VTAVESWNKGDRVFWRGNAADGGTVRGRSWDAVTIAWDNGQVATLHHSVAQAVAKEATISPVPVPKRYRTVARGHSI